ncbi:MAG: MinD/ParA family protein [Syntrophomonadaceae bacterium]|jgi:pilus assembly protein CpaE|nr:MinD/ParA family protein [Syntrophomonadaceae bacterium]
MKKIKILLVDDNDNTRASIRQLLELDDVVDIVGEAADGNEALEKAGILEPELVLMDINMPKMDGIEATRKFSQQHPHIGVILISINDEIQNFRRAMLAGAKEYLVKPLSPEEISTAVRQVAELSRQKVAQGKSAEPDRPQPPPNDNKLITIFGTKGGVGKSVICTNLAVSAAQQHAKVAMIDLDVQFGDLSIMVNVNPRKTIAEMTQEGEKPSREMLESYLYERYGVQLLSAPNKPELAEMVVPRRVQEIFDICRQEYTYTFVDTPSFIDELSLTALEQSDLILLIITLDLPTIKNVKKGIDILKSLQLLNRARLILNRSSGIAGIEPHDIERVLDMKIKGEIPSDGKLVVSSLNQGIPFVRMNPKAPISKGIQSLLRVLE